jgi:protein phosphatase PTC7
MFVLTKLTSKAPSERRPCSLHCLTYIQSKLEVYSSGPSFAIAVLHLAMRQKLNAIIEGRVVERSKIKVKLMARKMILRDLTFTCLVHAFTEARTKSATSIQRLVRGYLTRKQIRPFARLGSETAFLWRGQASQVELRANFTSPPWTVPIPMQFIAALKAFATDYLLSTPVSPGKWAFKFIVDGCWTCNDAYQIEIDEEGNSNNTIELRSRAPTRNRSRRSLLERTGKSNTIRIRAASRGKALVGRHSEDALFISEELAVCGVADGVGSWSSAGVDPSLFSNELMRRSLQAAQKYSGHSLLLTADILREVAKEAHLKTRSYGSSTLLLCSVVKSTLHFLSVGDSRIAVLRLIRGQYKLFYVSKEQQHSFNCPFQVSCLPSVNKFSSLRHNGFERLVRYLETQRPVRDPVSKGITGNLALYKDDIVVVGTDGLFDNLFSENITAIVNLIAQTRPIDFAQAVAEELLKSAYAASRDPHGETPFSAASLKNGKHHSGGKPDDISVIVLSNS